MDFFGFEIMLDFSWVYNLGSQPIYVIAWHYLINGGWILFLAAFIYGGWGLWVYSRNVKFANKQTYIFLAIDIPRNNIQTPKAVESIFVALAGAHMPLARWEKYAKGEYQLGFSCEIVSIDGYIQFLIRTPAHWRNLVEAAVYAQYPEAEITEVEDYLADLNPTFPSDEYNIWGADLNLVKPDYYPIRTYMDFQERLDNEFKDPIASLLEVMSKIGQGEQIWIQILVYPSDNDWHIAGQKAIDKIIGREVASKRTWLDKTVDAPLKAITFVGDEIMRGFGPSFDDDKKDDKSFNMMQLTPQQKREVESIMYKIDKINFNVKMRLAYFAKREVFKKALGVSGLFGAIKQFNTTGLNGFKPGANKTQARIAFVNWRVAYKQNSFFQNFKGRNSATSGGTYKMNVEELATLYHFPYIEVKVPKVKTISAKKGLAPVGLPVDAVKVDEDIPEEVTTSQDENVAPVVDYDNDYFEDRFAVDKSRESDNMRKEKILNDIEKQKQAGHRLKYNSQGFKLEYKEDEVFTLENASRTGSDSLLPKESSNDKQEKKPAQREDKSKRNKNEQRVKMRDEVPQVRDLSEEDDEEKGIDEAPPNLPVV